MTRRKHLVALAGSVAAVAVVTLAIELFKRFVPVLSLGVLYVFAVLVVAVVWGMRYAIPVAVASMLAFNWFHLPPLYTFTLADGSNWFALAAYVVVAVTVSVLADRVRRRAAEAEQREREAALLADVAEGATRRPRLAGRARIDLVREPPRYSGSAARGSNSAGTRRPRVRRRMALEVDKRLVGTLYLPEGEAPSIAERGRFLPALASLLAVAVDRERLEREAVDADALRRSDTVKTAVLQAVSHDLRSPLTAIRGSRRWAPVRARSSSNEFDRAELVETIRIEAGGSIGSSRTCSSSRASRRTRRRRRPSSGRSTSSSAQALDEVRGSERVEVVFAHEVPPVQVDATQIQHVLANLLENALKFSSPEAPVQVRVTATRKEVIVRIVDRGPGIPESELERIFEPFQRGGDAGRGAGLGLAIARGFRGGERGAGLGGIPPRARSVVRARAPPGGTARGGDGDRVTTCPGGRRRAADPARSPDESPRGGVRGRDGGDRKQEALAKLAMRPPDAVILDLVLPDGRGDRRLP